MMRLNAVLDRGLGIDSLYSGFDCPRWALEPTLDFIIKERGWRFRNCVPNGYEFQTACDWGAVQQELLCTVSHRHDGSAHCVFGDIIERMPKFARDLVYESLPAESATDDQKRGAYLEIRDWLFENRQVVFLVDAQSSCLVHDEQCFVHTGWRMGEQVEEAPPPPPELVEWSEPIAEAPPRYARPWAASVAGVTCVAWSTAGNQEGTAHVSELYHHVWQIERITMMEKMLEDIAFMECTPRYPAEQRLKDECDHWCYAFWVVAGSQYMGFPSLRERVLGVLLNRKTVKWMGPATQEQVEVEFTELFARSVQMPGGALIADSEEARWNMYLRMANNRHRRSGRTFTVYELQQMEHWELLMTLGPPGCNQRFGEWIAHMQATHPIMPGEPYICDLDHRPNTRSSGGREFPSQLTHGTIMSILERDNWKIATPLEHLGALGVHSLPEYCRDFPESPVVRSMRNAELNEKSMKELCGNGMHLQTQAAWMLYVLCNVAEVDQRDGEVEGGGDDWGEMW